MTATAATIESAAEHATARVPIAAPDDTVGAVRARLFDRTFDCASHVVVCDGERFAGLLPIERVFASPAGATVASVMDPDPPVVGPGIDQEVAAWRAVQQQRAALAVVDAGGRFVGLIPPDRLAAVLAAEHIEDLARHAGLHHAGLHHAGWRHGAENARATTEEPVRRRFVHRLPWLLLGLAGALLAADLVGWFESHIQEAVALAFFIPGIVYMADAVGTQTETIVIRGLSLGVPLRHIVIRELLTGLAVGLALALIAAPIVWWHWQDRTLAASVGIAMLAACSTATGAAMALPWLFDVAGIDPAFGSGPLATVIQDLLSIWIYLLVATAIIG